MQFLADGDLVGVSSEVCDIVLDPGEGGHHVMQPLVTLHLLTVHTEPAQATQAVVEGDLTIIISKDHHVKDHSPK